MADLTLLAEQVIPKVMNAISPLLGRGSRLNTVLAMKSAGANIVYLCSCIGGTVDFYRKRSGMRMENIVLANELL